MTLFARKLVLWCSVSGIFVRLVLKCLQSGNVLDVTITW